MHYSHSFFSSSSFLISQVDGFRFDLMGHIMKNTMVHIFNKAVLAFLYYHHGVWFNLFDLRDENQTVIFSFWNMELEVLAEIVFFSFR